MDKNTATVKDKKSDTVVAVPNHTKRLICESCCCYTVMSVFFILCQALIDGSFTDAYINNLRFLLFLPFAFAISLGNLIYRAVKTTVSIKYLLHFLCFMTGFILCIFIPYIIQVKPADKYALIFIILVIIFYAIGVIVHAAIMRKRRSKENDSVPYVSQFKG